MSENKLQPKIGRRNFLAASGAVSATASVDFLKVVPTERDPDLVQEDYCSSEKPIEVYFDEVNAVITHDERFMWDDPTRRSIFDPQDVLKSRPFSYREKLEWLTNVYEEYTLAFREDVEDLFEETWNSSQAIDSWLDDFMGYEEQIDTLCIDETYRRAQEAIGRDILDRLNASERKRLGIYTRAREVYWGEKWNVVCFNGNPRELEELLLTKGLKIKFV